LPFLLPVEHSANDQNSSGASGYGRGRKCPEPVIDTPGPLRTTVARH
jgi:hypothetical protein